MPALDVDGDTLVVHLSPAQKFWAFHRNLQVPVSAVRSVRVTTTPWSDLRGWRISGTTISGTVALGRRRHASGVDFVAMGRVTEAVEVEMNDGPYRRLVVSVADPQHTASAIAAAAGIAR